MFLGILEVFILKVISYIGVLGSGKNFRADQLINHGFKQVNFADPLRNMAWSLLGWKPNNEKEYEEFKLKKLIFNPMLSRSLTEDNEYINTFDFTFSLTGREFLQKLGTEMRNIDEDFWANLWLRDTVDLMVKDKVNVCCSDLRYGNELRKVYSLSNIEDVETAFIFTNFKSHRYEPDNPHKSEKLAQFILNNYDINDGEEIPSYIIKEILSLEGKFN